MVPTWESMWRSWLIIGALVLAAAVAAWRHGGPGLVGEGLGSGASLFVGVLPNLLLGFALAGFMQVLLPRELISGWMGEESGLRGVLVGSVAGMLTPGGPFTHFPILASLLNKGAGVGPVCAYVAAWALIGLNRFIVWELPILGPTISLVRFGVCLVVPPIVGVASAWVFRVFRLAP